MAKICPSAVTVQTGYIAKCECLDMSTCWSNFNWMPFTDD